MLQTIPIHFMENSQLNLWVIIIKLILNYQMFQKIYFLVNFPKGGLKLLLLQVGEYWHADRDLKLYPITQEKFHLELMSFHVKMACLQCLSFS